MKQQNKNSAKFVIWCIASMAIFSMACVALFVYTDKLQIQAKTPTEMKIENQFIKLDGSHKKLNIYIHNRLEYPGAYKHIKTTFITLRPLQNALLVETMYSDSNKRNIIQAVVDLDGNILHVIFGKI